MGKIIVAAFHFHFIALAIDVMDRRGPSNKMRCQLQLKKTKKKIPPLTPELVILGTCLRQEMNLRGEDGGSRGGNRRGGDRHNTHLRTPLKKTAKEQEWRLVKLLHVYVWNDNALTRIEHR